MSLFKTLKLDILQVPQNTTIVMLHNPHRSKIDPQVGAPVAVDVASKSYF